MTELTEKEFLAFTLYHQALPRNTLVPHWLCFSPEARKDAFDLLEAEFSLWRSRERNAELMRQLRREGEVYAEPVSDDDFREYDKAITAAKKKKVSEPK